MTHWTIFDWVRSNGLLPESPGVYAIFGDGKLLYIGQSSNVYLRLLNHRLHLTYSNYGAVTPWGTFRSLVVKIRKSQRRGDWLMIEYRLISRLKPPMNCVGGPKPRKPFKRNKGMVSG